MLKNSDKALTRYIFETLAVVEYVALTRYIFETLAVVKYVYWTINLKHKSNHN